MEKAGFCCEVEDGYDAVVVGSGYGGSVAACRLSMAGVKVCLIEKGRRWEAQDFPTDSFKIMSALRVESSNSSVSFGSKDALFQVHIHDDSILSVACGLGGGSLVNAGVMLPTPVRARRSLKWPKEWERDWESCEASASAMLRIQGIPAKFQSARIIGDIAGEDLEETPLSSMKLSVNFDIEEPLSNSKKGRQMNSCLACGNCLAGCPYNAKRSTDKNYLVSAIQAGCTVKTESQVQWVVENPYYECKEEKISGTRNTRRWLVFFNETDYASADFVILSAGVLGTSTILFQSQMRGLRLSERLGSGFSCNGNTVAYLAGSPAPLNGYGLDKKQLSKIPFQERPGPSISSSYTSSLGFTIQSAILPTAYIYLLFKGIFTYGWPPGFWFLHGILDKIKHLFGLKCTQAIILCGIGYDESDGNIALDSDTMKLHFSLSHDPLLPKKIEAFQKLTKKLGGILFMSRYRSTSVHLLGGCNASSNPSLGVCNHNGQVFDLKTHTSVHPGLYVCDASLIPCSVGINPCLTIATAAEHVSRNLVKDVLSYKSEKGVETTPKIADQQDSICYSKKYGNRTSAVIIRETMRGYVGGMPCTAYLKMKMNSLKQQGLDKNNNVNRNHQLLGGKVGGYVVFKAVEKEKLHIIDGEVDLCKVDNRTPYTQYMHYRLLLVAASGSRYVLEGKKILNPFLLVLHAWRESSTMHVTFRKVSKSEEMENLKGELSISIMELLKSLISLKGSQRGRFVCLFSQTLLRTYILQIPRGTCKDLTLSDIFKGPYPRSSLHDLKTEDGLIISCRQWKSSQKTCNVEGDEKLHPVLLLNGHAAESFWLPTEPTDLVRTLLEEGHEIWLLQTRLHPMHSSNNFTIEDIGKYDIPSVISKIQELHGPSTKVHVVAHCVGGLAIHIALMGGHVSATQIASLCCTNSSMFFKLTAFARIKMWLPLLPISMMILGENRILPLFETLKASPRHRLLKSIARFIPRYERCTCNECEVLSGIFGNGYWHNNISPALHHWLNKENLPSLPMAAFPHIRKICNAGFILDSAGNNSYLIHPERMALSTLYVSGGRTLLVTPETSFLANKYMKLHQPGYRHDRVVVDGFGHSDLLIGEESHKKVFPHILSHIRLAEEGENTKVRHYSKESLTWSYDEHEVRNGLFGCWLSPTITIWLLLLLLVCVFLFF